MTCRVGKSRYVSGVGSHVLCVRELDYCVHWERRGVRRCVITVRFPRPSLSSSVAGSDQECV